MLKKIRFIAPIAFTLGIIFLFYLKRIVVLKYYPPICNLFIFIVFFSSVFTKEPIVQKFARMIEGTLSEAQKIYTKNVTYVWCVFLFVNFLVSVFTITLSDRIWMIYNGFVSYILVGTMFGIEYIVRLIFRKRKLI